MIDKYVNSITDKLEVIVTPYTGPNWQDILKGVPMGSYKWIMPKARQTGKTNIFWESYWNSLYAEHYDILKPKRHGIWHVVISKDFDEKMEWLHDSFGEGGRNKKRKWRANWVQLNDNQDASVPAVDIWLKEDAAMLFKLRWCV